MKEFIKNKLREHLLNEEMKPTLDTNFTERGESNLLLIATDNENDNEHFLVLGVDLKPIKDYYELGYGFVLYDKNLKVVSKYMRTRDEVAKYLPNELKNKITPEVFKMTKNLINKNKANKIYMETFENITNDNNSFKRFENIANFITSLGYKVIDGYPKKNELNKFEWMFINNNGNIQSVNENTIFKMEEYKKLDRKGQDELYFNIVYGDKEFLTEWLVTSRQK